MAAPVGTSAVPSLGEVASATSNPPHPGRVRPRPSALQRLSRQSRASAELRYNFDESNDVGVEVVQVFSGYPVFEDCLAA